MPSRDYFSEMLDSLNQEDDDDSLDERDVPPEVRRALDARAHIHSPERDKDGNILPGQEDIPTPPVDEEAVRLFQEHVKSGKFDPMIEGGYIEITQNLGVVPKSTDPYTKDVDYNRHLWTRPGRSEEFIENKRLDYLKRHKTVVRYLRYREYAKKHGFHLKSETPDAEESGDIEEGEEETYYWGHQKDNRGQDEYIGPKLTLQQMVDEREALEDKQLYEDEDDLTQEQMRLVVQDFTMTFFWYLNEKCRIGKPAGVKNPNVRPSMGSGLNTVHFMEIEGSVDVILEQCDELEAMYDDRRQPIGMYLEDNQYTKTILASETGNTGGNGSKKSNKKKNNKKKKSSQNKPLTPDYVEHRKRIEKHLPTLFYSLEEQILTNSTGSATLLGGIAAFMSSAVLHDSYIANCVLFYQDGKVLRTIMNLCSLAAKYAMEAFCDTSRHTVAGYTWWKSHGRLMEVIMYSFQGYRKKGMRSYNEYRFGEPKDHQDVFNKTVLPYFLDLIDPKERDITSPAIWYCEQSAVWFTVKNIMKSFPKQFAIKFIKKNWDIIDSYCRRDIEDELSQRNFKTDREEKSERFMAAHSLHEAADFIADMCGYGFDVEYGGYSDISYPAPLGYAMLKKGVVPLLVKLSYSKYDLVSSSAIYGLAQMIRIKDCRDLLNQLPNNEGIKLVHAMMTSKNANCQSNNLLIILRLSWDEMWVQKLMALEPKIEECCLKLAAFTMKSFLDEVDEAKVRKKKLDHCKQMMMIRKYKTRTDEEKLQDENRQEELDRSIREVEWELYESDIAGDDDIYFLTISRVLMLFTSSLFRRSVADIKRLGATDFLHLVAASIDCPFDNISHISIAVMNNFTLVGGSIKPSHFPDPEHIVRTMLEKLDMMGQESWSQGQQKPPDQKAEILTSTLSKIYNQGSGWKHVFDRVLSVNPEYRVYMTVIRTMAAGSFMPSTRSIRPTSHVEETPGIHDTCRVNTDKLAKCNFCGKLESRKGEWKKCSRCNSAF